MRGLWLAHPAPGPGARTLHAWARGEAPFHRAHFWTLCGLQALRSGRRVAELGQELAEEPEGQPTCGACRRELGRRARAVELRARIAAGIWGPSSTLARAQLAELDARRRHVGPEAEGPA